MLDGDTIAILSREDAIASGSKWYFTGVECQSGHICKRYVNTKICYKCKSERNKRNNARCPKTARAIRDRTYVKNKEKHKKRSLSWASRNRSRSNGIKKKCKERHSEGYKASEAARVRSRRASDPLWRLNKNTSKGIWDSLQSKKAGRKWEACVGFTINDLISRLESLFRDGMSWDNYGSMWEIDHIKPTSICDTFEEAWAITNLQPLECSINRSKCNRYIG